MHFHHACFVVVSVAAAAAAAVVMGYASPMETSIKISNFISNLPLDSVECLCKRHDVPSVMQLLEVRTIVSSMECPVQHIWSTEIVIQGVSVVTRLD